MAASLQALKHEGKAVRGIIACLGCLMALCVMGWASFGSYAVPSVACALICAFVLQGHVTVSNACACIVGVAAAIAGMDETVLVSEGSSVPAYAEDMLDALAAQAGLGPAARAMAYLWPLVYAGQGALIVACGLLGLAVVRRIPYGSLYESFIRLHVPGWGIVALVVAAACWTCSQIWPERAGGGFLNSAGSCMLVCLRVLFFLQGLAAIMFLMERQHIGAGMRIALVTIALLAEFSLYAVCVFGALDTVANFRRIDWHARDAHAVDAGRLASRR